MMEELSMRKQGYGLWVLLTIAVINLLGARALALLVPAAVVLLVLRRVITDDRARRQNDEPPPQSQPQRQRRPGKDYDADARWKSERKARQQEFDEQRARQSSHGGIPVSAEAVGEEFANRAQELKDLLNAGIIEQPEYNERLADLRDEWRR
jgi:hypothetical protein